MTEVERQALEDARAACLASAEAIAAVLAGTGSLPTRSLHLEAYVPLKTAAAAWGIADDSARKRVKCIALSRPDLATKRGAGRWWVHREALR
ncbi:hypothetical protein [Methylobacterium sp. WL19]|uniref:hypothetical protein n=1 Tax=Methylobacterium sp. WL19 TaxID=2603896 RepID=UPI0011CBD773|nr:hypothetical protein [Methylobacterium sp. WL19]TXN27133.1 hypothetical protein FV220_12485 [Methylobacterium sp. WL19]